MYRLCGREKGQKFVGVEFMVQTSCCGDILRYSGGELSSNTGQGEKLTSATQKCITEKKGILNVLLL